MVPLHSSLLVIQQGQHLMVRLTSAARSPAGADSCLLPSMQSAAVAGAANVAVRVRATEILVGLMSCWEASRC